MTNYYNNKNVLITGGLGFIGSNLAHQLLKIGANVSVVDNMNPLYGGNLFNVKDIKSDIKIVLDDIRNTNSMIPLIEKSDLIFHLAAQVSYIDSLNMPFEDLGLNARATLNILETCRKYNTKTKIIFSSSRMVYGKVETPLVTEQSETNPLSLYGIHKLTSEKYLLMYFKDFGIPTSILRLTNPYGPRQQIKHSKYSLVGWFIRQAMENKTIKIYGDGQQLRDYIYVDDIVNAMILAGSNSDAIGQVVNIGSGSSTKFCDMVSKVVNCVNQGKIEFIPWPENYEKIETGDVLVDIAKLRRITSWSPRMSLDEGIKLTYDYYFKNSIHYI